MIFRSKNQKKFKYIVTDFVGNKRVIYADSYAEMIQDKRVNSIKSSARVRA